MTATEDKLLTIRQAASLLGVHPLTLRNWTEKGAVPCLRTPGGHRRYRKQDLQRALVRPMFGDDAPGGASAAIVAMAKNAVRDAVATPPQRSLSGALQGVRARLNIRQRRSLAALGQELLTLVVRYSIGQGQQSAPASAPREGESLLRRSRQIGRSYGRAAQRLGLTTADVVATFAFFQDTVVRALCESGTLDYSRLNRIFSRVLVAAVDAADGGRS